MANNNIITFPEQRNSKLTTEEKLECLLEYACDVAVHIYENIEVMENCIEYELPVDVRDKRDDRDLLLLIEALKSYIFRRHGFKYEKYQEMFTDEDTKEFPWNREDDDK